MLPGSNTSEHEGSNLSLLLLTRATSIQKHTSSGLGSTIQPPWIMASDKPPIHELDQCLF